MDMDVAAAFLAGSVLFSLSLIALVMGIVAVNNIFSKYWKPVKFFHVPDSPTYRFVDETHEIHETKAL